MHEVYLLHLVNALEKLTAYLEQYAMVLMTAHCLNNFLKNFYLLLSPGIHCNGTFDQFVCWPYSPPGKVSVPCPSYLPWLENGNVQVVNSLQDCAGNPAKGQIVLVSLVSVSSEVSEGFLVSPLFTSSLS